MTKDIFGDVFFTEHSANIIYRRENSTLISKKPYSDWREIQDEFEDYHIDEDEQRELIEFFKSDCTVFEFGYPNKTY